jgi:hypothetical protein
MFGLAAFKSKCSVCNTVKTVLSLVFTGVMTAALLGFYYTHIPLGDQFIGSMEGSLAILALVSTLMLWTLNLDCSSCPTPFLQQIIVFSILILATVAAILGMYKAHMDPNGNLILGTTDCSLSILAFVVASTYWAKHVQTLCQSCNIR